jgi:hypothetical protein
VIWKTCDFGAGGSDRPKTDCPHGRSKNDLVREMFRHEPGETELNQKADRQHVLRSRAKSTTEPIQPRRVK